MKPVAIIIAALSLTTLLAVQNVRAQDVPVPEYLGVFALSGNTLIELTPFPFPDDSEDELMTWNGTAAGGADSLQLVVYGDYRPSDISLMRVSSSVTDRRLTKEEQKPLRIKPLSGVQGIIGSLLLVTPHQGFKTGHYVVQITSTGEAWAFSTAAAAAFFATPPMFAVTRCGEARIGGTVSGVIVYQTRDSAPTFLSVFGDEIMQDLHIDKLICAGLQVDPETMNPRDLVYGLSSAYGNAFYIFDLTNRTASARRLVDISYGLSKRDIARYYDIHFPAQDRSRPIFAMSGSRRDDTKEPSEDDGYLSQPKKAKIFDVRTSDWDTGQLADKVYCVSEVTPELLFVGTNKDSYYLEWNPKKEDWKVDKRGDAPKSITYFSRGTVGGVVYAIDESKSVHMSTDTGATWSSCSYIDKAEHIEVCQTRPDVVAYKRGGRYMLSTDAGESFSPVEINGSEAVNYLTIDCTPGIQAVLLSAATNSGIYSRLLDQPWRPIGRFE